MVISNEPGYYKTDAYGIRIENLVAVIPTPETKRKKTVNQQPFLCFETLTLAPIDLILVEKNLLNYAEINWLNKYHRRIRNSLLPLLDKKTQNWLKLNSRDIDT